jgi:hypothetical protein
MGESHVDYIYVEPDMVKKKLEEKLIARPAHHIHHKRSRVLLCLTNEVT